MFLREIEDNDADLQVITDIYNSNKKFLIHHLGHDRVDRAFVIHEIKEIKEHGFRATMIESDGKVIGVIDYMIQADRTVYLSLMMLDKAMQSKGLGARVYRLFEKKMVSEGAKIIRIDVVNDYTPNVIPFWEKMGFVGQYEDSLTWGDKTSNVLVMKKVL